MVTIFNRKQLILTYDMAVQAKVREILAANDIDYYINPYKFDTRSCAPEYKIYVRKKDFDEAEYLIRYVYR